MDKDSSNGDGSLRPFVAYTAGYIRSAGVPCTDHASVMKDTDQLYDSAVSKFPKSMDKLATSEHEDLEEARYLAALSVVEGIGLPNIKADIMAGKHDIMILVQVAYAALKRGRQLAEQDRLR